MWSACWVAAPLYCTALWVELCLRAASDAANFVSFAHGRWVDKSESNCFHACFLSVQHEVRKHWEGWVQCCWGAVGCGSFVRMAALWYYLWEVEVAFLCLGLLWQKRSLLSSEGSIFVHTSSVCTSDNQPKDQEAYLHHKFRDFSQWPTRSIALGSVTWPGIILGSMCRGRKGLLCDICGRGGSGGFLSPLQGHALNNSSLQMGPPQESSASHG